MIEQGKALKSCFSMSVDMHAHYLPFELAERLRQRDVAPCLVTLENGSEQLRMPIGTLAFNAGYTDITQRLSFMDQSGIQRQLLSLPGLFGIDSLPYGEAAPLTRIFNDDVAGVCRHHPTRFAGLAALPLADMQAAVTELRHARESLGLLGAVLPVNAFLTTKQLEALRPLFEAGNELGAHFFIHPGPRPDEVAAASAPRQETYDYGMARRALAVQAEVGEAMATLMLSTFLDAYPNITVQIANLGGTFPAVIERIVHMTRLRAPEAELPSARKPGVYVDCASLGPAALTLAAHVYGADRIVLGTDCPIFDTIETLAAVRDAQLTADQREAICSGNAAAILSRLELGRQERRA